MMLRDIPFKSECTAENTEASICTRLEQEPRHLMQLCQKSRWECMDGYWGRIEQFCERLIKVLSIPCEKMSSNAREQLLQRDDWGNTPLHLVCYKRPPASVVHALLQVSRSVSPTLELRTIVNNTGATPLFICCKTGADRKVINLVLHGDAVSTSNISGIGPFQALLKRYEVMGRLPTFRNQWTRLDDVRREQLIVSDSNDCESCETSCSVAAALAPIELMSQGTLGCAAVEPRDCSCAPIVSSTEPSIFPVFWRLCRDLMRSVWEMESPYGVESYASDLHGVAFVADALPNEIVDMIIRLHSAKDMRGSSQDDMISPLCLALARRASSIPTSRSQHAYCFRRLVEMDPWAARHTTLGTGNRTLLCHAIASGYHWSVLARGTAAEGPVQSLFRQCPDAVDSQDEVTGLHPFMLAAASTTSDADRNSIDNNKEEDEDPALLVTLHLDTIYNLLRASPGLIQQHI